VSAIITADGVASPKGVAPDAKIVAVKVLGTDGGPSSDIVSALDWIATNRSDVRVVNLSVGSDELYPGSCDDATASTLMYASAIGVLRARGVTVFAASGNEASPASMASPACVGAAVSVGAVYDAAGGKVTFAKSGCSDESRVADEIACFSNTDSALDLLAPGGAITTAKRDGGQTTSFGTSAATPHASAVAALMLQARPTLSADQVESTLKQTGVKVADPRTGATTPRIDALAAINALPALPPPPPPPNPPGPPGVCW
jgi:subtilisin family serine protease